MGGSTATCCVQAIRELHQWCHAVLPNLPHCLKHYLEDLLREQQVAWRRGSSLFGRALALFAEQLHTQFAQASLPLASHLSTCCTRSLHRPAFPNLDTCPPGPHAVRNLPFLSSSLSACPPERGSHASLSYLSYLIPHTSYLIPHTSYLIPHSSYLIPHTSYFIPHTAYLIPHTSYLRVRKFLSYLTKRF